MKKMHSPALTVLVFTLIGAALIGAGLAVAAPNGQVVVEDAATPQSAEPATTPATCRGEALQWLGAEAVIIVAKPKPDDVCNCNRATGAADCKRVCGEAGGSCEITTECTSPDWEGVCFCNN